MRCLFYWRLIDYRVDARLSINPDFYNVGGVKLYSRHTLPRTRRRAPFRSRRGFAPSTLARWLIVAVRNSVRPSHLFDLFVNVLLHYRSEGKYLLHEYVVMPDHFHALITPAYEISLERAVQFIKGGFSFRLKLKMPLWQAGFTSHRVRDEEDFEGHREYIRMNPVRAGLAGRPEEYTYSSASGRFALDPMPPGLKETVSQLGRREKSGTR